MFAFVTDLCLLTPHCLNRVKTYKVGHVSLAYLWLTSHRHLTYCAPWLSISTYVISPQWQTGLALSLSTKHAAIHPFPVSKDGVCGGGLVAREDAASDSDHDDCMETRVSPATLPPSIKLRPAAAKWQIAQRRRREALTV